MTMARPGQRRHDVKAAWPSPCSGEPGERWRFWVESTSCRRRSTCHCRNCCRLAALRETSRRDSIDRHDGAARRVGHPEAAVREPVALVRNPAGRLCGSRAAKSTRAPEATGSLGCSWCVAKPLADPPYKHPAPRGSVQAPRTRRPGATAPRHTRRYARFRAERTPSENTGRGKGGYAPGHFQVAVVLANANPPRSESAERFIRMPEIAASGSGTRCPAERDSTKNS